MCTIIFPWGKYSYQRVPMGISRAPDIFEGFMSDLVMEDLMYVRTYIDDLLIITSGSLSDHLAMLDPVLSRLWDAGLKSQCIKIVLLYGGDGISQVRTDKRLQPQKVQAILALKPPSYVKELRTFLGIFQYYRDMGEKRSGMLANKTRKPWHWDFIPKGVQQRTGYCRQRYNLGLSGLHKG